MSESECSVESGRKADVGAEKRAGAGVRIRRKARMQESVKVEGVRAEAEEDVRAKAKCREESGAGVRMQSRVRMRFSV